MRNMPFLTDVAKISFVKRYDSGVLVVLDDDAIFGVLPDGVPRVLSE